MIFIESIVGKLFPLLFSVVYFIVIFFFEKFLNQLSDGKMSGSRSRCSDEKIINIKCKKGKNDTRKNRKVRAVNTHQCHVENREFSGLARAIFSDFKGFQQYFFPAYYLAWCWEFCSTLFVLLLVEEQQVERSFACFCWIKSTEKWRLRCLKFISLQPLLCIYLINKSIYTKTVYYFNMNIYFLPKDVSYKIWVWCTNLICFHGSFYFQQILSPNAIPFCISIGTYEIHPNHYPKNTVSSK